MNKFRCYYLTIILNYNHLCLSKFWVLIELKSSLWIIFFYNFKEEILNENFSY